MIKSGGETWLYFCSHELYKYIIALHRVSNFNPL